jgi:hypothetical protein
MKIKEIYKHNSEIIQILGKISDYKRLFTNRIASIDLKIKMRKQSKDFFADKFES